MFSCARVYRCYFDNTDRDVLIDVSIGQRVTMDLSCACVCVRVFVRVLVCVSWVGRSNTHLFVR